MFHVEQFCLPLCCAAAWLNPCGATNRPTETTELPCPIALGGNSDEEETRLTNQALSLILRGCDEQAASLLRQASAKEQHSPLTDVSLLLCTQDADERQHTLEKLNANFDEETLAPTEAFYVKALLALLSGDIRTAAREFREHAEQYRRDRMAACWDIFLHHYLGVNEDLHQRAETLLNQYSNDATVVYVCALVDEFAARGQVSPMALRAAELLPDDITSQHLRAHLQFLRGDIKQAADLFHVVRVKAERKSYEWYAAGIYEASCLTQLQRKREALKLRREMNAEAGVPEHPQSRTELLARWEVNFLPLRVLVTRREPFDLSDIKAAALAATPRHLPEAPDAALCYRNTLVQILMARYHHRIGRKAQAGKELNDAAQTLELLRQKTPHPQERFLLSCHTRACEACELALNLVRAEVFESTAAIWRERENELHRSASLLLPPVIPGRAGE